MSRNQSLNFKKLVEAYYAGLFRFAYCLACDELTASDLTQHTFFIYANKGSAIKDASKVKLWLFQTLYHEYLRQRTAPHVELAVPKGAVQVASLDGLRAATAITQLDDTLRPLLALFYLRALSYPEMAEALDITVAEVFSRMLQGKSRLKDILAGHASG